MSEFSYKRVFVIGSSGGIGSEVLRQVLLNASVDKVVCVSRQAHESNDSRCHFIQADSTNEVQVERATNMLKQFAPFDLVISCIGVLHEEKETYNLNPEKRLEDINKDKLNRYFEVNTIAPALWLKHLPKLLPKRDPSHAVFFSARVGSIEDNRMGGWYGYRASKAALNMLLKTAQVELKRRHPKAVLVSYHPGTTDTQLSKPFQQNVPEGELFTTAFTVSQLLSLLPDLAQQDEPYFIDWQGKGIPW